MVESGEGKAYSNQVPHDRQHNIPSDGHKGNYVFISAFVDKFKAECTLKEKKLLVALQSSTFVSLPP